jgi:hypothetical protein
MNCNHTFAWYSVIPPTHCPNCGACLSCGQHPYPQPTPPHPHYPFWPAYPNRWYPPNYPLPKWYPPQAPYAISVSDHSS